MNPLPGWEDLSIGSAPRIRRFRRNSHHRGRSLGVPLSDMLYREEPSSPTCSFRLGIRGLHDVRYFDQQLPHTRRMCWNRAARPDFALRGRPVAHDDSSHMISRVRPHLRPNRSCGRTLRDSRPLPQHMLGERLDRDTL